MKNNMKSQNIKGENEKSKFWDIKENKEKSFWDSQNSEITSQNF